MQVTRMVPKTLACAGALLFASNAALAVSVSDVTYEGENADAAEFVSPGNVTASDIDGLFGPTWSRLLKTDETTIGTFGGVEFTLDGTAPGETSGTYTLSWTDLPPDEDLPLVLDMTIALKAGNGYAAYLFNDLTFDEDPAGSGSGSGSGTWEIHFTNAGGQIPDLSHASIYFRDNPVPVPGTLLLLSLGLFGLRCKASRRQVIQTCPAGTVRCP